MPALFVLRAYVKTTYNDPDEGEVSTGTYYRDVRFSLSHVQLEEDAATLNRGFTGTRWCKKLQGIDPEYDGMSQNEVSYQVDTLEISC